MVRRDATYKVRPLFHGDPHERSPVSPVLRDRSHLLLSVRTKNPGPGEPARDDAGVAIDPVLERRRRISGLVRIGKRGGYALFGVAIVLFFVGLVAGFGTVSGVIVACIAVGSILLAPAIVFGYAVGAAERDDREHGRPTMGDG